MKQQYATQFPWLEYDLKLRKAKWKRYRSCQARIFHDGDSLWIKSYNTLVAMIDRAAVLVFVATIPALHLNG